LYRRINCFVQDKQIPLVFVEEQIASTDLSCAHFGQNR
jgi:hypothetical protein